MQQLIIPIPLIVHIEFIFLAIIDIIPLEFFYIDLVR